MEEKLFLSWDDIIQLLNLLHNETQEKDNGKVAILGVSRGGLCPAVILSHLKKESDFYTVGVKSYSDTTKGKETIYQIPDDEQLKRYNTLYVVDDICDTGKTLKLLQEKILHPNMISVSIIYRKNDIFKPNYCGFEILDKKWVVFPWENNKYTTY
jgi:hypoxanthine phosphoribosyltransferase